MLDITNNYLRLIKEFKNTPIVFYSESQHHSQHLFPIVKEILKKKKVVYVTSDKSDPILYYTHHNLHAFNIGLGIYRILFFQNIFCKVFITSLPDLNTFSLKKSKNVEYYIYVHHSIVSCHMAYREGAFDEFDEIFCVGPHHIKELSAQENIFKKRKKVLTPHGNAKIDALISHRDCEIIQNTILVAPSWGEQGLFEKHLSYILEICKKNPAFLFILRPHSETIRKVEKLEQKIKHHHIPNIIYDNGSYNDWLYKSELMISDWSGVAYEFSVGLGKPVIFLNINTKVNNPKYTELDVEPFEIYQRSKFGCIANLEDLDHLLIVVNDLRKKKTTILIESEKLIYNLGTSHIVAAETIYKRIDYTNKESLMSLKSNYDNYVYQTPSANSSTNHIIVIIKEKIKNKDFSVNFLRILSKKIDVANKLFDSYDKFWKKISNSKKLQKAEILICCYYLFLCLKYFEKENKSMVLKIANSLLKIVEWEVEIKEEYLSFFQDQINEII